MGDVKRAVYCPAGCGSTSFRASRRGVIAEDFTIDEETGEVVPESKIAEAGGHLWLNCSECGRSWRSTRDIDLARFVESNR